MFSLVFGIPLSVVALITGIVLGLGSRWGVFRYPWVLTKLCPIIAVMLVGTVVIGPGLDVARQGSATGESILIAGAMFDVAALATATILSVYKPGRPFQEAGYPPAETRPTRRRTVMYPLPYPLLVFASNGVGAHALAVDFG